MSYDRQESTAAADELDTDPDIEDVFEELEELEEIVDTPAEREQVRETIRVLRRTRTRRTFGRLRDSFDSRDVGEGLVGAFVFGMPMVVEEGTLEIGEFIARRPLLFAVTVAVGVTLVLGILHAVRFEEVEADLLFGVIPIRLVSTLTISAGMAAVLMTIWGRADWAAPSVAAGQITVTAIVMAVGASLGDVLPGT
ncbi:MULTISPECIES: DUF2391 family protein [Halorussus]|uniref:DUF2391 family protein n=1 Tax=Halorussus TaxID=1070314 RepID=UPI0020A08487|nr:DUF2391 family protein [Halorussus vallis]USZ77260.1 TIGR02587 family membrane protein [Halorussus vallis]